MSETRERIPATRAGRDRAEHRAATRGELKARGTHRPVRPDLLSVIQSRRAGRRQAGLPRAGRRFATLLLLAVLAIGLLAAAPGLRGVVHRVGQVDPIWIAAAIALELASDVSFVVLFRLFFDRLRPRDARALAWTEMASGALLPGGGAGGLAIGGWLIHMAGVPTAWIVRRSGGLFWLTSAVSSAALISSGFALAAGAGGPHDLTLALLPAALAAAATVLVLALPALARSLSHAPRWLAAIAAGVRDAERTTFSRPSVRLLGALGYLGFDMAVLWICLRALGRPPGVPALMLAYSIGYAANALPVPGGIGVLDAGLTGSLVLYGVSPAHAAAAVLIYHATALWVPGLGGVIAYLRLRPRLLRSAGADCKSPAGRGDGPAPPVAGRPPERIAVVT